MSARIAAVVLAAGGSARMGTPKQLLRFQGRSLVRRGAETALASSCEAVFAVLGAHADRVARELAGLELTVVHNAQWEEGLGSSIRCGIAAVQSVAPPFDAALLLLADQPRVAAALLDRLVAEFAEGGGAIVCCAYAGSVGPPAVFPRSAFPALRALRGDCGAKQVLLDREFAVRRVACEAAALDIDAPGDYEELVRNG